MTNNSLASALAELEESKRRFGPGDAKILSTLKAFSKSRFSDADSLIRFHETLLFLRAYPSSAKVLNQIEQILKRFEPRVLQLREADADLSALDDPEVSGIDGTSVTSNFSYPIVRWLVAKYPGQVSIDWDWFGEEDRFGATMPRFLPLLEDDAMVEAHVPYREWMRAAKGRERELVWLINQFESLTISDRARAELYDSLKLHVTWRFGARASRTGMKRPARKIFFHDKPLIQRCDISLAAELSSPSIPVERLSRAEGEKILDQARETSAVRYRELHGFTYGDARRVLKADLGRGTEAFMMGVPPENRLPLRAYHAALIFKNGVPVAYFEGLSIFERMESGFNLYYTFRDGETAWLYARVLRLMRQLLGVTVFSIDPYQVGHENEEGIESGAFWFYRKLGFRPVRPEPMKLTLSEERKMAADRSHRTSAQMLRRLAAGHMLFEVPNINLAGRWDSFEVRNIGIAVQRCMARAFHGNPQEIRSHSLAFAKRALRININRWSDAEKAALENLSLVLAMIPDIENWNAEQKELTTRVIQAKAGNDEAIYLRLMQKHIALRDALIRLGS
jgi:hypothetical protein